MSFNLSQKAKKYLRSRTKNNYVNSNQNQYFKKFTNQNINLKNKIL